MTSYVQRVFRSLAPLKKKLVIKANEEISVKCPLVLKITRIYEFVQFHPSKRFETLILQIAQDRRAGDPDPSGQVL